MIYVDTSIIIATITHEWHTDMIQEWMFRQTAGALCISEWVATETSSALVIKMRRGEYDVTSRGGILSRWERLRQRNLHVVPVVQDAFGLATRLINDSRSTLRAGDALHLAVAILGRHSLATFDHSLIEAAARTGVSVETVA